MGLETRRPTRMARALEGQSQPLCHLMDLLSCLVDAVLLLLLRLGLGGWGHWVPDWGWVLSHMRGERKRANASRFQGTRIVLKTFCSSVMTFKHLLSVFALHDTQSLLLRYWWWHVWTRAWEGLQGRSASLSPLTYRINAQQRMGGKQAVLAQESVFQGFTEMHLILHTDSIRLVNSAVGRRDTKVVWTLRQLMMPVCDMKVWQS